MSPLLSIFRDKLIPWSTDIASRIVVGRTPLTTSDLPESVQWEKRPLRGKREIIKNRRVYQNTRSVSAVWPTCHLNEVSLIKLACVLDGAANFQLGREAVLCGPGHFILIPPGVPHPDGRGTIVDATKSTFCEILYFLMYPNALQCWIHRYETNHSRWSASGNYLFLNNPLIQLSQIAFGEIIADTNNNRELHQTLFQSFLLLTQANIEKGLFTESISGRKNPIPAELPVPEDFSTRLTKYIQSRLQDQPTLEMAAQHMYLSRTQFARRVRAETGKTYIELLNEHRIKTAKVLLRDSDWTVSNIATFVGYQTPHYLHKLFRQQTGMTPDNYRAYNRKTARSDN